jgi:hypothetical protein
MKRYQSNLAFVVAILLSASTTFASDEYLDTILKLFKEAPLKSLTKNKALEVYRITIYRSFYSPMMFTLSIDEGAGWLQVQKARLEVEAEEVGLWPTKVIRNSRFKLNRGEVKSILSLLSAADFWKLPSDDLRPGGLDGSEWRVEGVKRGRYHITVRSNPLELPSEMGGYFPVLPPDRMHREGCLTATCLFIWALANEADEPIY